MARQAQPRIRDASAELTLPPLYTAVRLRELGDAFAHAKEIAAESGAGTLVHVGRFDLAEFALVLEPEEPLSGARRVFYAGMSALADSLIGCCQPETDIAIRWPDTILVNGGAVGGGRLAWPEKTEENAMPPWLVFGAMIRVESMIDREPGLNPDVTALAEEGFGGVTSHEIIESFARHFMVALDAWQESGFAAVAKTYIERLPHEVGMRREIEENGDLLVRRAASATAERTALTAALAVPRWLDAATGEPLA